MKNAGPNIPRMNLHHNARKYYLKIGLLKHGFQVTAS
jgi:hypothetical protein